MTSFPLIENVTLSISNISNEIFPLIKSIRPNWTSLNTRLVTFTEGLCNTILGLFDSRTDADDSDGLVIRIYGAHTELYIDRQFEINAMKILSENKIISQRVLIQFQNGIICEYVSGQPCSTEDIQKESITRLIAMKLAQFHNVPIEKVDQPYIITLYRKLLHLLADSSFDLSSIRSDIDQLEKHILPKLIPNAQLGKDLVLCHNDLVMKNIIYHEKNQTISFIDFEYAHVNYALFDIANYFVEYAGGDNPNFDVYPSRDEQKRWLEIYFQTRGMTEQIIDDHLCDLIDQFSALAFLLWGLWGLVQSNISQLDFDYIEYAQMRFNHYKNLRRLLFQSK